MKQRGRCRVAKEQSAWGSQRYVGCKSYARSTKRDLSQRLTKSMQSFQLSMNKRKMYFQYSLIWSTSPHVLNMPPSSKTSPPTSRPPIDVACALNKVSNYRHNRKKRCGEVVGGSRYKTNFVLCQAEFEKSARARGQQEVRTTVQVSCKSASLGKSLKSVSILEGLAQVWQYDAWECCCCLEFEGSASCLRLL